MRAADVISKVIGGKELVYGREGLAPRGDEIGIHAIRGGDIIVDLNVRVAISHTFIGDLTIKLMSPDGTLVTLLNRPGLPDGPDDGTGVGGDSSDLSFMFPILYDDEARSGTSAELMGMGIGGSDIVGDPSNGSPDNYSPGADGAGLGMLRGFDGLHADGRWTLYIGDSASAATGTLDSWSLTFKTIPAPGALGLLALVGLARRRRRR